MKYTIVYEDKSYNSDNAFIIGTASTEEKAQNKMKEAFLNILNNIGLGCVSFAFESESNQIESQGVYWIDLKLRHFYIELEEQGRTIKGAILSFDESRPWGIISENSEGILTINKNRMHRTKREVVYNYHQPNRTMNFGKAGFSKNLNG